MGKAVDSSNTRLKNPRYERKFLYPYTTPEEVIQRVVLCNPFNFSEIYHRRAVNNIYYDDQAYSFYHQNVAGDDKREKIRLRWYGDIFEQVKNPTLEIKRKYGVVGDKLSFALSEIENDLSKQQNLNSKIEALLTQKEQLNLCSKMQSLTPSLYNSYERRYFLSHCKRFRITIDYNMSFYNPNLSNFIRSKAFLNDVVMELKYAVDDDQVCRELTQHFTARLSKNSKYVRGVQLINHMEAH